MGDGRLLERSFADRKPLASCSDVESAFKVAVDAVGPPDICSSRMIVVTSDLKSELPSPTRQKPTACKPPSFAPPAGIPWDKLQGITVKTFFTPRDAIVAWTPLVQQHGLDFVMYTGSGPDGRLPRPQPNPRCAPDAELPARLLRKAAVATTVVVVVLGLFFAAILAVARRQASPAAKPAAGLRPVLRAGHGRRAR